MKHDTKAIPMDWVPDGPDGARWESGDSFVRSQTAAIAREFKTFRPRPRNRAMGFVESRLFEERRK